MAFTPLAPPLVGNPTLWARTKAHLRNPVTWKSLVYLLAHVPFGIVAPLAGLALDGNALQLTPKEFDLLLFFAAHPGWAFSRTFLLRRVWDGDYEGMERMVDTHVTRLRKKLGVFGEHIVTVWGVGYRFEG
jgi:DNA-binding response OmpR family regulator